MLLALSERIAILEKSIEEKFGQVKELGVRPPKFNKDGSPRKKSPLTNYQRFCNVKREEVKACLVQKTNDGIKLGRGAVLRELGKRWSALNADEKMLWFQESEPEPMAEEKPEPEPMTEEKPEPEPKAEEKPEPEPMAEEKTEKKKEKKAKKEKTVKKASIE